MLRRLLEQTIVYTVANIFARGTLVISLLVLPLFLTPEEYGVLGMVVALAALVSVTVPLEVTQGLARYYGSASASEKRAFAGTAWWLVVSLLGIAALPALVLAEPLCQLVLGDLRYLAAFRLAIAYFCLN